jgi:hypothetical protein
LGYNHDDDDDDDDDDHQQQHHELTSASDGRPLLSTDRFTFLCAISAAR